ncbi:MAG: YacL family protein [Endozoicomonas sp.]
MTLPAVTLLPEIPFGYEPDMEYEFRRDITGHFTALFSMGHEAFGAWLTEEVGCRSNMLAELYRAVSELQGRQRWEYVVEGELYTLRLSRSRAEVRSSTLSEDIDLHDARPEELEGMSYYDDESMASCGLDDFKTMLLAWEQFIRDSR